MPLSRQLFACYECTDACYECTEVWSYITYMYIRRPGIYFISGGVGVSFRVKLNCMHFSSSIDARFA